MLINYLKIAIRNIIKHKTYSFINITGLAIGITCCLLISLYVLHELSYDRFHKNADQIYRIVSERSIQGKVNKGSAVPAPFAIELLNEYPEIKNAARMMNLLVARFQDRIKEVGLRKVVGANRLQLVKQFIGEAFIFSSIAVILAIILFELSLPIFNSLFGKKITLSFFNNYLILPGLISFVLLVGFIAGGYPAYFLSRFQPVSILGQTFKSRVKKSFFRNALVVIQFTISIILMITTLVIYFQLDYIRNKKLGFNREQVVIVPIKDFSLREKYKIIKSKLLQNPNIKAASAASGFPGGLRNYLNSIKWEGGEDLEPVAMPMFFVDYDFIKLFKLELVTGREFSQQISTDSKDAYILNETAIKKIGWDSPIGKRFHKGHVIGVVKDFHFFSLHNRIEPLVLRVSPRWFQYISIKIATNNISNTMNFIKNTWQDFHSNQAFEYYFLDDYFDNLYRKEQSVGKIFSYFSLLAICIACLGLFGLATFTVQQRTKEIGIRKVLGASVPGLANLLINEFIKLIIVANFVAWPISWFVMNKWLQNFAYRINIEWWTFLLAGGLALVIALLTVSYQAVRAATANPVESLRYE